ncbi:hypothetical protein GCM10009841_28290 [Microlunatus panaciterrae]|uniref:MobA-like NTP transferase domain-containing protein n=1 Tax=Microlunatus panaciterrae TaxID=400768 RepID=A0ABS2RER2_9ACTN|nr:DUF2064 domain-containing protein [Microlunatus panaciterrae]MBM7797488.1 hypothetical protein [Microlunatus panaciterrae]
MTTERRRLALVHAAHTATGAPPGIDRAAFSSACLSDSYEVLADLEEVRAGIVGAGPAVADLLWPADLQVPDPAASIRSVAEQVGAGADELVMIPADVPDLPGLVLAKVFKALNRADVCIAPARNTSGCVAIGLRLPWPDWITVELDLDTDPADELRRLQPGRGRVAIGPDWHRMCSATAVNRLDPRLEGWESTRALLSGHPYLLAGGP